MNGRCPDCGLPWAAHARGLDGLFGRPLECPDDESWEAEVEAS